MNILGYLYIFTRAIIIIFYVCVGFVWGKTRVRYRVVIKVNCDLYKTHIQMINQYVFIFVHNYIQRWVDEWESVRMNEMYIT